MNVGKKLYEIASICFDDRLLKSLHLVDSKFFLWRERTNTLLQIICSIHSKYFNSISCIMCTLVKYFRYVNSVKGEGGIKSRAN